MQKTLRTVLAALVIASVHPRLAAAQTFEGLGTRAAGMGGAFVAVADDASAVYWNPGGLAAGSFFSLALDWSTAEAAPDSGLRAGSQSAALVALAVPALGVSYYRLRANNVAPLAEPGVLATSLTTHHTGVTLVQSLIEGISIGTTLKYVRGVAATGLVAEAAPADLLEQAEDLGGSASNQFDADIGILAKFGTLRAGLTLRNVREPEFELPGTDETLQLERQIRGGVALTLATGFIVAADVDFVRVPGPLGEVRNFAFGAESRLTSRGLVRGGFRVNTLSDQPGGRAAVGALGGSYAALSSLFIDAQVTFGGDDAARGWGIAGRVIF